jgi:hypothetical protein
MTIFLFCADYCSDRLVPLFAWLDSNTNSNFVLLRIFIPQESSQETKPVLMDAIQPHEMINEQVLYIYLFVIFVLVESLYFLS